MSTPAPGVAAASVFIGASQVVTCAGPARARRGREMREMEILEGAAVAVVGSGIAAVGPQREILASFPGASLVDCTGRILTPGLVDSHTHALFGRNRADEQEMRAAGMDYMEIARQGGGIHSSVRDLRQRSDDELLRLTRERLRSLASYGTTTVEIKSGYALDTENEIRSLRLINALRAELPIRIVPTWLGAHEIPHEYRSAESLRRDYLRMLIAEQLPQVASGKLAVFADIFCEPGVYTVEESRELLMAAREHGLRLKLHADELRNSGGAELAASLGAVSADHLAAVSEAGIASLAGSDVVATVLPGTMLFLGRESRAPVRRLIEAGAAVALASDFNPGTSPTVNLPLIMTLGVSALGMSVNEAICAVTVNGAAALGLADETGQLAPGFAADIAVFDAQDVRELPYWYGNRLCRGSWLLGKPCYPFELGLT